MKLIQNSFPQSERVTRLGLNGVSDIEIWEFAKNHDYTILTFDGDFFDIAQYKGHPPKVIWLSMGNTTTTNIAKVLKEKETMIKVLAAIPTFYERTI